MKFKDAISILDRACANAPGRRQDHQAREQSLQYIVDLVHTLSDKIEESDKAEPAEIESIEADALEAESDDTEA